MPTASVEPLGFVAKPLLTKVAIHRRRGGEGQSTSATWPTRTGHARPLALL